MTSSPHHVARDFRLGDKAHSVAVGQQRAKRWMVALTAALIAVPVGVTVEQLAAHGTRFFICRAPAVGATSHRAADCPKP